MPLQLAFAREILCIGHDDKGSRKLELVKIGLRALIADVIYIEV